MEPRIKAGYGAAIQKPIFKKARAWFIDYVTSIHCDYGDSSLGPVEVGLGVEDSLTRLGINKKQTALFLEKMAAEGIIKRHPFGGWAPGPKIINND